MIRVARRLDVPARSCACVRPKSRSRVRPQGVVSIPRPRGYFGDGRDVFTLDGKVPPGISEGVPAVSSGKLLLPAGPLRAIPARFNDESITVQNRPAREGHVVFAGFHY